jgi:hypothetical protein
MGYYDYDNNEVTYKLREAFRSGMAEASAPSITRLGEDKNGDLWIRSLLINDKVNARGWSVDRLTLPKNVYSIVGRPLVLGTNPITRKNDHPGWDTLKPADANFKEQEKYKIDTVEKVFYDKNTDSYYCDSKISNRPARNFLNSFIDIDIPIAVSPQIVFDPAKEQNTDYKNWIFTHLAVVDKAAYPDAKVIGACTGDYGTTCGQRLQQIATTRTPTPTATSAASAADIDTSVSGHKLRNFTYSYGLGFSNIR